MIPLTLEVPEIISRRLTAFADADGRSADQVAAECIASFLSGPRIRRAILKARKTAGEKESLADLGWLDGYAGQNIDELLLLDGLEKPERLIIAVAEGIEEKLKTHGISKRTGVERVILAVLRFQGEVDNGGYHQFFTNPSREVAPVIVEDLERIGCKRIANITRKALEALRLPKQTVQAIEQAMKVIDPFRDKKLSRCDNAFWKTTELTKRLYKYIKSNRNGILI